MKGSLYVADSNMLSTSSLSMSKANSPFIPCQTLSSRVSGLSFKVNISWPNHASCIVQQQQKNRNNSNGFAVVGCAKWGMERELEEDEMKPQEDEDEEKGRRSGMGRFRHKCGEREGVVELLECLEREAIMGEDVGKEPNDYNRRAQIFDRSSQVFQALKELDNDDHLPQESS